MTRMYTMIALGLFAAACGSKIDAGKVEQNMVDGLAKKGITAKVSCPGGRAAKTGDTFQCDATDDAGKTYKVDVTQKDDNGTIEWKLDGSIVDTTVVVADAKSKLPSAEFNCAHKAVVVKGSDTIKCPVKDGGKARELIIKVDNGNVSYEVTP